MLEETIDLPMIPGEQINDFLGDILEGLFMLEGSWLFATAEFYIYL
jgi:hypothetical protein